MFSILDIPKNTTLEQARKAVQAGLINLEDIIKYLKG
jgi:hypothetical protein